jgi:Transposase DDE domain group 1
MPPVERSSVTGTAAARLEIEFEWLWFSAFAHLIMSTLQAGVLKGTELEAASIGQIRLRLFKIAARLKTSARRIHIELCSACPLKALFSLVHQRLSAPGSPA